MRFIELFAGIGGFRYGLEKCNLYKFATTQSKQTESEIQQGRKWDFDEGRWNNLLFGSGQQHGYQCVYANEFNRHAADIYEKNFGQRPDTRDITTVDVSDIPDHDLLTGGFPCQAFSIAGKRKGFEDTRGTLFFEIARILAAKRPGYLLLENVAGLLSHDGGRTFQIILATLDELGYDLQWQVLNSKNFGVPQNRERVFIVGHLRGQRRPEVFPIRTNEIQVDELQRQVSNTLTSRYEPAQATGTYIGEDKLNAQELIMRDGRDNRNCLRSGRTPEVGIKGMSIRRLTPIECERLQGFPDNWTAGVSDTQRYKCLGNAVTTNVITEIGKRLILL